MANGTLDQLWYGCKSAVNLKIINLSNSLKLSRTPDLTGIPNLESLILEGCRSLSDVHPSLSHHKKLQYVNLVNCKKLVGFMDEMRSDTVFPVSYDVEESKIDDQTESYTIVFDKNEDNFRENKEKRHRSSSNAAAADRVYPAADRAPPAPAPPAAAANPASPAARGAAAGMAPAARGAAAGMAPAARGAVAGMAPAARGADPLDPELRAAAEAAAAGVAEAAGAGPQRERERQRREQRLVRGQRLALEKRLDQQRLGEQRLEQLEQQYEF
ncbi:hypothetical protein NC651_031020 [Populus alba x Populus x berolinensis]|nr:hypothetical protein NC651_031020 [Populus alba x Populus x berolinensis]